jgi:hypothetical protein
VKAMLGNARITNPATNSRRSGFHTNVISRAGLSVLKTWNVRLGSGADMFLQVEYLLRCTDRQLEILMAALAGSAATFRIGGDDLDPVEMSRLLSGTPSAACSKNIGE